MSKKIVQTAPKRRFTISSWKWVSTELSELAGALLKSRVKCYITTKYRMKM